MSLENNNSEAVDGSILGNFLTEGMKDSSMIKEDIVEEKKDDVEEKKLDDGLDEGKEKPKEEPKEDDFEKKEEPKKEVKKEETKEEEEDEDLADDSIINILGTQFPSLEGEFQDTEEGLVSAVKSIAKKEREEGRNEGLEKLYNDIPLIKDVKEHLEQGGSLASLIHQKQIEDFSKVELDEENTDALEDMYRRYLIYKGNDDEDIEELVNSAKDTNTLFNKATKSKTVLVDAQKDIIAENIKNEKAEYQEQLLAQEETIKRVKGVLASNKINGYDVAPDVSKKLGKFILDVDKDGKTERDNKYENLTEEQWLFLDMMVMEDFKPLVGKAIKTPTSQPLKLRVKKAKETVNLNGSGKGKGEGILSLEGLRDHFANNKQ